MAGLPPTIIYSIFFLKTYHRIVTESAMDLDDVLSYATNFKLLAGIFGFLPALYLWYR